MADPISSSPTSPTSPSSTSSPTTTSLSQKRLTIGLSSLDLDQQLDRLKGINSDLFVQKDRELGTNMAGAKPTVTGNSRDLNRPRKGGFLRTNLPLLLWGAFVQVYGLFTLGLFMLTAVTRKRRFYRMKAVEKRNYEAARERLWSLDRSPFGVTHDFLTLNSGKQIHYVHKGPSGGIDESTGLVVFVHGFPDSWFLWSSLLSSPRLVTRATLVALDLPNYGGSDSVETMDATTILTSVAEFIVAMRDKFLIDGEDGSQSKGRVIVVGHDWGAVVAFRLAAEAPMLAERFVISNGAHPALAAANVTDRLSSATRMVKTYIHRPLEPRLLQKALHTLTPILSQLAKSGYVFVFNLPRPLIHFLHKVGDHSFMRYLNAVSGHPDPSRPLAEVAAAQHLASSNGPSEKICGVVGRGESGVRGEDGELKGYGESVAARAAHDAGWFAKLQVYRDAFLTTKWSKPLPLLISLQTLEESPRRSSSLSSTSGTLFDSGPPQSFKSPVTVLWGKDDVAIDRNIALGGISEWFSVKNSQVVMMSGVGHWTPVSSEGGRVFESVIDWSLKGERGAVGDVLGGEGFEFARVMSER